MSRITFCTKTDLAELSGRERCHMAEVVATIGCPHRYFYEFGTHQSWSRKLFPDGHYVLKPQHSSRYEEDAHRAIKLGHEQLRHPVTGEPLDNFALVLNTALAQGNDVVKLMARIHGQCEIHAHIPASECRWVADIIRQGLESHLLNNDEKTGWTDVVRLLISAAVNGEDVVTHYSVTEDFPGWDSEKDAPRDWDEHFSLLSPELAIQRKGWETYSFGSGHTLMSLQAEYHAAEEAKKAYLQVSK